MFTAKLIERRFHNVPGKLRVSELFFDVPVDYSKPADGSIRLFARSVSHALAQTEKDDRQLPWFVYLTGGPGFGCQQPQDYGWVRKVLDKGYQVLFLDQRGTGMSSTITAATLALKGDAFKQAEYLRHFRADSIVRDCEAIRQCLTTDYPEGIRKWSILGQSFGGFCAVAYLSNYPDGLKEVFITGGLPPLVNGPDPVYQRTYIKVQERNKAYYAKFPEDVERVKDILDHLKANKVLLPSNGTLTPARFQQLGIFLGMHGGLDTIHDIVLRSINDLDVFGFLTRPTLSTIEAYGGFDNNVIYAVLHEAIYCQGQASQWSADRFRSILPQFQLDAYRSQVFFTGEMIYKDMFESYTELRQLYDVADILATATDWPALYDEQRLARNDVPVYAVTYLDDMYVHFDLASDTASKIKGVKQFITNMVYHDGLRSRVDEIMKQLFALKEDSID